MFDPGDIALAGRGRAMTSLGPVDPTVLLVLPWSPSHAGGVTGVVRSLIAHWDNAAGCGVLLTINDWEAASPKARDDGLHFKFDLAVTSNLRALAKSTIGAPWRLLRTLRLLRAHRVRSVNFHYSGLAPLGIAVLKACGLYRGTLLISFHGTDVRPPADRVEARLRAFLYRHVDHLVACSGSLAERMIATLPAPRAKVRVIYNGVDTALFRPDAPPPADAVPVPATRFLIGVGAFIERKAHLDLVEGFARVAGEWPDLALCLVGADGPTRADVLARAEALGVASRVHLRVGIAPTEVARLLATATLCVQPALAESLPLAVLEAGACGVPILASNIPGHDELIFEGSTGHLFRPSDPDDCARAIRAALTDLPSARIAAQALRERVTTLLTWSICVGRYQDLYFGTDAGASRAVD